MNSGFSKLLSNIFAFSLLSLLTVSSFWLWREYESVKKIKSETILATTKELSKNLSLPVKVFDLAAIDQAIKNSSLSNYTKIIKISNNDGEKLFSNKDSLLKECGSLPIISVPIMFGGAQAGKLDTCVDNKSFNFINIVGILFLVWTLFFTVVYYFWKVSKKESDKLARIEAFIKDIDTNADRKSRVYVENDQDVADVYKSIFNLLDDIKEKNEFIEKSKIHEAVSKKARSIAHDIKSPVGLIRNVLEYDSSISSRSKDKIYRSTDVIQKISDDILDEYKIDGVSDSFVEQNLTLKELWENKKIEFKQTDIEFVDDIQWDKLSDIKDPLGLVRSISNLVNNSVEALEGNNGSVKLSSKKVENKIEIRVADNGPGICKSVLDEVGKSEITTKPMGNGIGLLSVKNYLDDIGGVLDIKTDTNGTVVDLAL